MRFAILGPLEASTDDGGAVRVPELKVRALLACLLAHHGRAVPAGRLIEGLWGPQPPGRPLGALRARVSQLRRALEEAEPGGRELVVTRPPGYVVGGDTDARRFQEAVERSRAAAGPGERAALLAEALAWWRGPAFADFADVPLVRGAALLLEEQRLAALEDYADVRLDLGQDASQVGELTELAAQHPARERFHALLMRALYRSGRQADALEVYRALRGRLRDELGLDPGPEIVALHQAILEQSPGLRRPPRAPAPVPARLPEPLTELVGRDEALAELVALPGTARLVTLTGAGGVGKSRLALEAARRLAGGFDGGAYLVELSGVPAGSPPDVADAVAAALGLRDDGGAADQGERVAAALASRRTLLVLDNCEHVVEAVAKLAELLLRTGPGTRVLATSREPLGLAGEVVRQVPPLDAAAAARLFVLRAAENEPGLVLDAGVVESICRRLDGIPLALELAAARVRSLGVRVLAGRLDDRFRLLSAGRRSGPAHQRTLRAAIDWSWELLTEPERVVLRRLAVQAGGCTLEAAERVCAVPGPIPGGPPGDAGPQVPQDLDPADVVDLLGRLVDRSLVVRAGDRYRLLESVAAYALERLGEAGEREPVLRRYAVYYTQLAECARAYRSGPARHHWVRRLDAEAANLRAALEAARSLGDTRLAARLTGSLGWYRTQSGRAGA
ncbi:putative ATPase/DNA-binding SARP family transcriptional activator [Nonomuraea thailandensis]|uniref:ATPase/DNA-binding SARP family transcriptional activator n=1 Tax=Nonomuraea thailandensis TaxID=1188745 RepID=A0A9X2K5L9_9ACTN|nr:BTAD domain-containing putative transcriptional regulator [Nonomuraea thailandensis]MCP2357746.1 putative ATPase/DNA-binding SARP family transcriptional activator [Nonomuraea thailandensis]